MKIFSVRSPQCMENWDIRDILESSKVNRSLICIFMKTRSESRQIRIEIENFLKLHNRVDTYREVRHNCNSRVKSFAFSQNCKQFRVCTEKPEHTKSVCISKSEYLVFDKILWVCTRRNDSTINIITIMRLKCLNWSFSSPQNTFICSVGIIMTICGVN